MFSCAKQPDGTEKGKALGDPGPDDSHLSRCHNTGAELGKVHCFDRLPLRTLKIAMTYENGTQIHSFFILHFINSPHKHATHWLFYINFCIIPPLLVDADTFLHEGVLVGIEQEVELSSRGHWNHEGPLQKLLNCAVASYILHEPFHIRPEVLHVRHSR